MNIFKLAIRNNKGVVILVNKWDLVGNKETNTARDFEEQITTTQQQTTNNNVQKPINHKPTTTKT